MAPGAHRSPRKGLSLDFADYREYHPGDDFRRIDYNLYARLDVLAVKLFDAEEDLAVRLLVDTSGSMGPGGKLRWAAEAAAALGFVALVRRDVVTVATVPAGVVRRFGGRGSAGELCDHLASLTAGGVTPLLAGVTELAGRPGPRGVTILISDLLTEDWEAVVRGLRSRGGEAVVLHVLTPEELRPTVVGDVDLRDAERGGVVPVTITAEVVRTYEARAAEWREAVAAGCRRAGVGWLPVQTDQALAPLLLGAWRSAGILR
jgi:uncharacterized protein (DUF58 family)